MKRILSLFATLCLIFALFSPVMVSAAPAGAGCSTCGRISGPRHCPVDW